MANVVNTNLMSINSQRSLAKTEGGLSTAMARLSSGMRINSAKDDAAGLAISERFRAQNRGNEVAIRNASDGISFAQTAEGALAEVGEMLQRMRDLAVQSANGVNSGNDRSNMQQEYAALSDEITRTLEVTNYNGNNMFAGDGSYKFQVGANTDSVNQITVEFDQLVSKGVFLSVAKAHLGSGESTGSEALKALTQIDAAIDQVTTERGKLGAVMNRFEHTITNLRVSAENQEASRSRIMDADFARESANLSRYQVLQQAGTAMLAQANQAPQSVLGLLR